MCIQVDDDKVLRSSNGPRIQAPEPAGDGQWSAALEHARASVGAAAVILSPGSGEALVRAGTWPQSAACLARAVEILGGPVDGVGAVGVRTAWGEQACPQVLGLQRRFGLRSLAVLHWAIGPARWAWIALLNVAGDPRPPVRPAQLRTLAGALRERCLLQQRVRDATRLTERLEDVARASGDWIWETDARHRYTWVHDSLPFAHEHGIRPPRVGELIPAGVIVNGFGEDEQPRRDLHDVLRQGEPIVRLVTRERGRDGLRYVSRSAVPLLGADGALRGYRGSARDVTQSLDAKAQLWRRDELLRRAKEQAEASSQAKSVLVSKVGHELRTPLNAIVGLAQLIQARGLGTDNARVDDWIAQIARTGWHMVDVLDLLMELGRAGTASASLQSEPVDVVAVVRDAMRIVEGEARARAIGIVFDSQTPVQAVGDRRAVCQVVVNLLSNAIKYNRPAGRVQVRVARDERAQIEIHDTGPGLSEEQIGRLYRPFERLGIEASEIQGHGLGLAICQELVATMGGTMQVRSTVGRGTTFTVLLPVSGVSPA